MNYMNQNHKSQVRWGCIWIALILALLWAGTKDKAQGTDDWPTVVDPSCMYQPPPSLPPPTVVLPPIDDLRPDGPVQFGPAFSGEKLLTTYHKYIVRHKGDGRPV